MLKRIVSIAGKPGLFRLVNQGKNMLIVEELGTGRRVPAYARDKVVSLGDVSMYTENGDTPLAEVLESLYTVAEGKPVDAKKLSDDEVRNLFGKVLSDFDQDRVYTTDIRKLFNWYNKLIAAGITEFKEKDDSALKSEDKAEEA